VRKLHNPRRVERLLRSAIDAFELDLEDTPVLTEAASGPFVVTPLLAALAGSPRVVACTRDSPYGGAAEVASNTQEWAQRLGVAAALDVSSAPAADHAPDALLVTNLGFVRPIDEAFVSRLPPGAAVALMWETWEHRPGDVDVAACRAHDVPVLGTDESDPRLEQFGYVGLVAVRLLLEAEVEVYRSRVAVVGTDPFGAAVAQAVESLGGEVVRLVPEHPGWTAPLAAAPGPVDAVVLAEHRLATGLVGGADGLDPAWLASLGTPLVHLSGAVDDSLLEAAGVPKLPERRVPPRVMTVTTDLVGPRPVVDLHAAGLRVGQALVEGMRRFGDPAKAEAYALETSPAMGWEPNPGR